jgi:hypothetical protein
MRLSGPKSTRTGIGAWGSSLSAGHVRVLGAIDRRLKAVAGQAPFVSGRVELNNLIRGDLQPDLREAFAADRRERASGEAAATIPVVDENPMANAALPSAHAYQYFYGSDGIVELEPCFPNQITLRSIEDVFGYEPGWYAPDTVVGSDLCMEGDTCGSYRVLVVQPGRTGLHVIGGSGGAAVYAPEGLGAGQWAARSRILCFKINRCAADDALSDTFGRHVRAHPDFAPVMATDAAATRSWINILVLVKEQFSGPTAWSINDALCLR